MKNPPAGATGSAAGGSGGGQPPAGNMLAGIGGGGGGGQQIVYLSMPPSSKTSEFERGSRHSSSDHDKFSSKEQWSKWQRALIGTAAEHEVINVLDPSYTPDPNDKDAVSLFKRQQEFMHSVFAKVLQEGKAVDILRNHSDPQAANFGDAQAICSDLRDHFEAGPWSW